MKRLLISLVLIIAGSVLIRIMAFSDYDYGLWTLSNPIFYITGLVLVSFGGVYMSIGSSGSIWLLKNNEVLDVLKIHWDGAKMRYTLMLRRERSGKIELYEVPSKEAVFNENFAEIKKVMYYCGKLHGCKS
ncbi:MAG: hypothetical protein US50_C0050G0005 [Candidatus Nomurabacteria bacterium GW2011_GWB1_37_5]|uniref:Uncharacterized protein n=1 Tax=Candidatus Nomurabacteria bacterium GW2011_GWB1_37_5 TaxID=1618742 RepID=A0A0G0GWF4_9BACT|nr:MAG: hypothetical protein US50_C0050G0005 [Candidatus Nomurabacteria bacterium GW2011_GWB1_37_5]